MNPQLMFFICMMLFFSLIGIVIAAFVCGYVIGRFTELDLFKEIQEGE